MADITSTVPDTLSPNWNEQGLLPVIAQEADTGEVLMLAWMNAEALKQTLTSGEVTYWSRSRQSLWRKGAKSGNTQHLVSACLDCDGDTLLLQVKQHGAGACHTGRRTCFFYHPEDGSWRLSEDDCRDDLLTALDKVLAERKTASPESSYVAALNAEGLNKILEKIGEEATEVILAAKDSAEKDDSDALVSEVADLWFHTMVMLAHLELDHTDVLNVLDARMGLSGLAEKAARKGHNAASQDA